MGIAPRRLRHALALSFFQDYCRCCALRAVYAALTRTISCRVLQNVLQISLCHSARHLHRFVAVVASDPHHGTGIWCALTFGLELYRARAMIASTSAANRAVDRVPLLGIQQAVFDPTCSTLPMGRKGRAGRALGSASWRRFRRPPRRVLSSADGAARRARAPVGPGIIRAVRLGAIHCRRLTGDRSRKACSPRDRLVVTIMASIRLGARRLPLSYAPSGRHPFCRCDRSSRSPDHFGLGKDSRRLALARCRLVLPKSRLPPAGEAESFRSRHASVTSFSGVRSRAARDRPAPRT